jgi:class 3 adenylate cyclase
MSQTRRLAAILAADVVGYSRLIGADEEGTLDRLRSIRAEIIDSVITEHRGRIGNSVSATCWKVQFARQPRACGLPRN